MYLITKKLNQKIGQTISKLTIDHCIRDFNVHVVYFIYFFFDIKTLESRAKKRQTKGNRRTTKNTINIRIDHNQKIPEKYLNGQLYNVVKTQPWKNSENF